MSKGWVSIHRTLWDNILFQDKPFCFVAAWVDLLLLANHTEGEALLGFETVPVKRGQTARSMKTLALRWGWSESKVRRFLDMLKKQGMIQTDGRKKATIITICKYDSYQEERRTNGEQVTDKRRTNGEQPTTNNNENNENNEKRERPAKKPKREPEQIDKELSRALYEKINQLDPTYFSSATKKALDKWPDLFRLMRQQDGRDPAEIRAIIDGLDRDGFWADKIRSPKALRGETKTGGDKFKKIQADLGTAPKKTEYFNGHTWDTDD